MPLTKKTSIDIMNDLAPAGQQINYFAQGGVKKRKQHEKILR